MNLGNAVQITYLPRLRNSLGLLVRNWPQAQTASNAAELVEPDQATQLNSIEEAVSCTGTRR